MDQTSVILPRSAGESKRVVLSKGLYISNVHVAEEAFEHQVDGLARDIFGWKIVTQELVRILYDCHPGLLHKRMPFAGRKTFPVLHEDQFDMTQKRVESSFEGFFFKGRIFSGFPFSCTAIHTLR